MKRRKSRRLIRLQDRLSKWSGLWWYRRRQMEKRIAEVMKKRQRGEPLTNSEWTLLAFTVEAGDCNQKCHQTFRPGTWLWLERIGKMKMTVKVNR